MSAEAASDEVTLLRGVPLFAQLTEHELSRVAQLSTRRTLQRDEILIREGDDANTLFVVLRGKVLVLLDNREIAELQQGEPVGELAFFAKGKRTADVIAARTSTVLAIERDDYQALAAELPLLTQHVLESVADRMSRLTARSETLAPRAGRIVTIEGVGTTEIPTSFRSSLKDALTAHGGMSLLTRADLPQSNLTKEGVEDWLRKLERGDDILVVISSGEDDATFRNAVCDNSDTRFAFFCSNQAQPEVSNGRPADQIIILRDHANQPPPWMAVADAGKPECLRHHIASDDARGFARLARFFSDDALGLVLSGGGALFTAQLGAVAALRDHGFDFDMYGGTSAGAGTAGALALGLEPREVMRRTVEIFIKSGAMRRFTLPVHSLIDHKYLDEQFRTHYGTGPIEDLPTNFFALSTSLSTNDAKIHRSGPLWHAIRSSTSIPAVLPPVVTDNGEVLIDGALVDNVPLSTMRQIKAGPNLVLTFKSATDWRVHSNYDEMPTRLGTIWQVISAPFRRGLRRGPKFPTITQILMRTMVVTARRTMRETELGEDIIMPIPIRRGMGFLEWSKGEAQFEHTQQMMDKALTTAAEAGHTGLAQLRATAAILGSQTKS
ncbi:MAG: cyclic nucleotide-binding and patatin-like phospholipase domain-containing protein [Pseudomonadota bacterium]